MVTPPKVPIGTLSPDITDTASGIALMYMGPEGRDDGLPTRLQAAMEIGDVYEIEHVTALMVGKMWSRKVVGAEFCANQWIKTFHPEDAP